MCKNITSKTLFSTAMIISFVSVALRCVNLFFFFDTEPGYYTSGAILPIVSHILLFLFSAAIIIISLLCFRGTEISYLKPTGIRQGLLYLPTVLFNATLFCDILKLSGNKTHSFLFILFAAISSFYFIYDLISPSLTVRIALGISTIGSLIAILATSYFDQTVQMNSPDKILVGLCAIFSALFVASEMKALMGTGRNWLYTASAMLTALFGFTCSLPSIIGYHAGLISTQRSFYAEYYLILAMAIYASIRLFPGAAQEAYAVSDTVAPSSDTDLPCGDEMIEAEQDEGEQSEATRDEQ